MIVEDLFSKVLIDPVARLKADGFYAVSGFATPSMAEKHLADLGNSVSGANVATSLILGMSQRHGVPIKSHNGFVNLVSNRYSGRFNCSYVVKGASVHSKVFIWTLKGQPLEAYAGSANYTLTGFGPTQREALAPVDAQAAFAYWQEVRRDSVPCESAKIKNSVTFYKPVFHAQKGLKTVNLSLLGSRGGVPSRSGLNWGQRPEHGREPNQAYIRIPMAVHKQKFFPALGKPFRVLTDDDDVLICSVAQEWGKAIHSTEDNSLMGYYFRSRIGVPSGNFVSEDDLNRYGRTDVSFTRIDASTYYLDFSVPASTGGGSGA